VSNYQSSGLAIAEILKKPVNPIIDLGPDRHSLGPTGFESYGVSLLNKARIFNRLRIRISTRAVMRFREKGRERRKIRPT
jgi:hypothetical protein